MGSRMGMLAILVILAVGCGYPTTPDAQGHSNMEPAAKPEAKQPEPTKSTVAPDKVDAKVETKAEPDEGPWPMKLADHPLGPKLGLPLDIRVDSPKVPERLEGPTPMSDLPEKKEEEKKPEEKDEKK